MKRSFIKAGHLEQDFELNLASIIDCFVVLIAFMLISTSFFSIGILDAEVAGASSEISSAATGETVVIVLKADRSVTLKQGKGAVRTDLSRLGDALSSMKEKVQDLKSAVLVADNSVAYRDVIASMEIARSKVGKVNLGGL